MAQDTRQNRAAQATRSLNGKPHRKKTGASQPADIRLQITEEEIPLHIQIHKVAMHMGLSPSDLAVYIALKYHADGTVKEDDVYPCNERIGKLANVSNRTVGRSIATLESKGMVKKTSTKKKGRFTVNHYLLLSPFRWADPELLKTLSYKTQSHADHVTQSHADHVTQSRKNKNQAFNKNQIQEPAANLGCTVVREADTPPSPESSSSLHAFLEKEQFTQDQKQLVETFQRKNDLSEDQVYIALDDLTDEGIHKDGLFYAMKQTTLFRPDKVVPYLYKVARAHPCGGPVNEPVREYTEGRRDNGQSGQHVPASQLPDAKTVYERIKDKTWDQYDYPEGVCFLTRKAFNLKDTESNLNWFVGSIWWDLKVLRQKELTEDKKPIIHEEVTFEAQG